MFTDVTTPKYKIDRIDESLTARAEPKHYTNDYKAPKIKIINIKSDLNRQQTLNDDGNVIRWDCNTF